MSTLMVEGCEVAAVERHPFADRLGMATVKGWRTAVGYDPASGAFEFAPGDRCIYFPPGSVLPPALAKSPYRVCKTKGCKAQNKTPPQLAPDARAVEGACPLCGRAVEWRDGAPGRTGAMAFCVALPPDPVTGVRPPGGRVRAARIRGLQSFGFILRIDPAHGDDAAWPVGTDLRAHFGVAKWEPPIESVDGEALAPRPDFHVAINGRYLDVDARAALCKRFGVEQVPTLYRGPFGAGVVAEHADGPTTMCAPADAGAFGGREGVVVVPSVERIDARMMPRGTNGRVIFESIGADYLARKGGTDAH